MTGKDESAEGRETRSGERNSYFLQTLLKDTSGKELGKARVRNLSATGMMAEGNLGLTEGMKLSFTLRGIGDVTGEVVRVDAGQAGICFDQIIDPDLARKPVSGRQAQRRGTLFRG